jgi:hypothetical protein
MAVDSFFNLHRGDRSKIPLYRYLFCVFGEKCVAEKVGKSEIPKKDRTFHGEAGATAR